MDRAPESHAGWTFLTNHSRVLAAIADDRTTRVRDIAARCRLTERAVQKIIADLEQGGYLTHVREGRSNIYRVALDTLLRHPADAPATVAELLSILIRHESTYSASVASAVEEHGGRENHEGHEGRENHEERTPADATREDAGQ